MSAQVVLPANADLFNISTSKTFIQVDSSPAHCSVSRELRGRSLTDTAVKYDKSSHDEENVEVVRWADFHHEPSTGPPSDGQHAEPDDSDNDIGQGVVHWGETPDNSPVHRSHSGTPMMMPGSPLPGACSPLPNGANSPLPFGFFLPAAAPQPSGASTPPPGVWAGPKPSERRAVEGSRWANHSMAPEVARALLQSSGFARGPLRPMSPGPSLNHASGERLQLSLSGCHSPSGATSPQRSASPGPSVPCSPILAGASRNPSRASTWSPSAPPGQLAATVQCCAALHLPMATNFMRSGCNSATSSPSNSRPSSPSGRRTPRTPSAVCGQMCGDVAEELRTTVVIRNLPRTYTREMVCEFMNEEGFAGRYDFVYLPTDFRTWLAFGYAFVNMVTPEDATDIMRCVDGFDEWKHDGEGKSCNVVWSDPYQGLEANIERYRNSPVMNESVNETYKPMLYHDGKSIPFPSPTKKLRQPRIRRSSNSSEKCDDQNEDVC